MECTYSKRGCSKFKELVSNPLNNKICSNSMHVFSTWNVTDNHVFLRNVAYALQKKKKRFTGHLLKWRTRFLKLLCERSLVYKYRANFIDIWLYKHTFRVDKSNFKTISSMKTYGLFVFNSSSTYPTYPLDGYM
jgi:hypothetical protein